MPRTEHWLQIENRVWDVVPNGIDRATGERFARGANGLFRPLGQDALIIRRYTANWATPDDRVLNAWDLNEPDPAQTRGTIPGATLEQKVGDEIIVHFRNADMRAGVPDAERVHSLHAHGVQCAAMYDGAYPTSPPDPSQNNKQGDRVAPGESFDYRYTIMHASNAGVWFYHDASLASQKSIALGAFGAIVVRAGGEGKAGLPPSPLRQSSDTPTHFANVAAPPASGDHLFVFHELAGVGECLNGRQLLGNTPTVLARVNTRVKFRVLNLTARAQVFHLHGHRWRAGDDWVDTASVASGAGMTFEWLEGTAENGGGLGEWLITNHNSNMTQGSLVVTEGHALTLAVGALG